MCFSHHFTRARRYSYLWHKGVHVWKREQKHLTKYTKAPQPNHCTVFCCIMTPPHYLPKQVANTNADPTSECSAFYTLIKTGNQTGPNFHSLKLQLQAASNNSHKVKGSWPKTSVWTVVMLGVEVGDIMKVLTPLGHWFDSNSMSLWLFHFFSSLSCCPSSPNLFLTHLPL